MSRYQSDGDDLIDASTSRLLIKKTWTHGQIVAAVQGVMYAIWGITATDKAVWQRALLIFGGVMLPAWTIISWWAMKRKTVWHAHLIQFFGTLNIVLYIAVLFITASDLHKTLNLLVFICTLLQTVETYAFLMVLTCLRKALVDDTGPQQPLFMSLDDSQP
jgi:hypothetical protein